MDEPSGSSRHLDDGRRLVDAARRLPQGFELRWNDLLEPPTEGWLWQTEIHNLELCDDLGWLWNWNLLEGREPVLDGMDIWLPADDRIDDEPVWREATVTAALTRWLSELAGRPDVTVLRDRDSEAPIFGVLEERYGPRITDPTERD